jgi:hypothetical protein
MIKEPVKENARGKEIILYVVPEGEFHGVGI